MLEYAKKKNALKQKIEIKLKFKKITNLLDFRFPKLEENYFRNLTFGIYLLKQAKSYTKEQLDENGKYTYKFDCCFENIIKVKINSRHSGSLKYFVYVEFDSTDKINPIRSWYCTCKVGARTVGTCAHVTSIIWYLGIGLNNRNLLKRKGADLFIDFCFDAKQSK